jgi:hypothetical protein
MGQWTRWGSNPRPAAYKTDTLPLSYESHKPIYIGLPFDKNLLEYFANVVNR